MRIGALHPFKFPARRARAAIGAAILLGAVFPAPGQTLRTRENGLPVGRFLFYPSLSIENTQDNNVFYQSEDLPGEIVESGLWTVRPQLVLELPRGENDFRFSYAPTYRDYTSDQFTQTENWSHFADLLASFRIGPSTRVGIRDHFGRGTTEVREVDAGGELTFSLAPFLTHEPEVDVTVTLGPRFGASAIARASIVDYRGDAAAFYDYDKQGLEGRLNYQLTQKDLAYLFYSAEDIVQERPDLDLSNRNVRGRTTGLGLRRTLNREVSAYAWAGYQTMEFEGPAGSDFSGTVFEVNATGRLRGAGALATFVTRQAYQSFFVTNNNYYVNSALRLQYAQQIGRRAFVELGGEIFRSWYPDPIDASSDPTFSPSDGERREDRGFRTALGFGYAFRPGLRAVLGYQFEERDSNMEQCSGLDPMANNCLPPVFDPFDYQIGRISMRIEMGWL